MMNNSKAIFSNNSDEWSTPDQIFKELDTEFHFNLDPCSTHENAKCKKHYTIEENGLEKSWRGTGCSVIHLIQRLASGSKNVSEKDRKTTLWLCC